MEAGGAISGANFGVYYTVLMQLGYNYFGKNAVKQANEGIPIDTILNQIRTELAPFNKAMMQQAFDNLPSVMVLTAQFLQESGYDLISGKFGAQVAGKVVSPTTPSDLQRIKDLLSAALVPGGSLGGGIIPAVFAEETTDSTFKPKQPSASEIEKRNMLAVKRNIQNTDNLEVLNNINLAKYGFNSSNFAIVSVALIEKQNELVARKKQTGKFNLPKADLETYGLKRGVSSQTLKLERNRLMMQIRKDENTMKSLQKQLSQAGSRNRHAIDAGIANINSNLRPQKLKLANINKLLSQRRNK